VITLDTSGIFALLDRKDPNHEMCRDVFDRDGGPYLISTAILSEIAWLLETRLPASIERLFLQDIRQNAYTLDWDSGDLDRIDALVTRYGDLSLGLSDAAVIACAERNGGRILTMDRRHFPVVARGEGTVHVLPV